MYVDEPGKEIWAGKTALKRRQASVGMRCAKRLSPLSEGNGDATTVVASTRALTNGEIFILVAVVEERVCEEEIS